VSSEAGQVQSADAPGGRPLWAQALCDELARDYLDRYGGRVGAPPQPFSRISPRATKKRPAKPSRATMACRP
jgi:hypothetical protein